MKRIRIAEISVALGLIISVLFSVVGFGYNCKEIRNNIVRIHILANSDSERDQNIKLKIRDELINCGDELFSGIVNIDNAEKILKSRKDEILYKINNILSENNVSG